MGMRVAVAPMRISVLFLALLMALPLFSLGARTASGAEAPSSDVQVMQAFTEQQRELAESRKISEERKHLIMFGMGVTLLVLLLATAILGVNMAIYGKRVFVAHTVCAGLSVTLAIVHSVVAIVWFFPF